jgi:conjugative transfer region protein (TIGR03748 family)
MKSMLLLSFTLLSIQCVAENVKTDRYTQVNIEPRLEQREPLKSVINIHFSQNIKTVGEAINELLKGSGYHWISNEQDSRLLQLELPGINRALGPIRLTDALQVLAGSSWDVAVDPLNRTIQFIVVQ